MTDVLLHLSSNFILIQSYIWKHLFLALQNPLEHFGEKSNPVAQQFQGNCNMDTGKAPF